MNRDKLTEETRKELTDLHFLHQLTRKKLMAALRSLGCQPVYAAEQTREEVLRYIARDCRPSEVVARLVEMKLV